MGYPRAISDQTIVAEAYELLTRQGPSNLTFERLGARVSLVFAAFVRRFRNKQPLLLEIDRYALERTTTEVKEAMANAVSSIGTIIAQFTTEKAFASSLERFINGEEFLLMDLHDKNLYANYRTSYERRYKQIVVLPQKAQDDGELESINNPEELARHLEMILHGSGHVWAMTQEAPIEEYISQHVQIALQPYRKQKEAA